MKVIVLALACFVCGFLWARLTVEPAQQRMVVKTVPIEHKAASLPVLVAAPKLPVARAVLPRQLSELLKCVPSGGYAGSRFVLRLESAPGGRVERATTVGAEFLSERERRCVADKAVRWQLEADAPHETVVAVTL